MWILLALLGAFAQAVGAAIKKKALQTSGMNNVIGFIAFAFAGLLFWILFAVDSGSFWMSGLSVRFWQSMGWYAGLNVLAVWFMYKALDIAEFNHLMPFMTLTSLSLVIPPMIFLGEFPSPIGIMGIILIVCGVLLMNYVRAQKVQSAIAEKQKRDNRTGVHYFLVTALCYTFAPTAAKISIQESSVLFASFLVHTLIAIGFLTIICGLRELPKLSTVLIRPAQRELLFAVLVAGLVIVFENGSINLALSEASVAYVFALKRMMPFFAFIIGVLYFKERNGLQKKFIGTVLMVTGAVIMTVF
jgi:drug/metabolite transporter (DMT)-like permease